MAATMTTAATGLWLPPLSVPLAHNAASLMYRPH